jgi:hypothetical protein
LGVLSSESLSKGAFAVGKEANLRLVSQIEKVAKDEKLKRDNSRAWYGVLAAVLLLAFLFLNGIMNREISPKVEEKLKDEVARIVKKIPARQKMTPTTVAKEPTETKQQPTKTTKSTNQLKRMGALAALGSLSKSKQFAGVNLAQANTSAGPGLGGTQGSGGVQTSLYGKGIVAAPVGVGGNVQGAGGYGTHGKGGGQAGYGKMTLVGATGAAPLGLEQEASVEVGLDRDQIAAVVNKNMGQITFCYEQGLQGDSNLAGRVAMSWVIGSNGAVKVANVASSTLKSKVIEDCIALRLKSWKFPLPQGGVDVSVTYPFLLRRTGQG